MKASKVKSSTVVKLIMLMAILSCVFSIGCSQDINTLIQKLKDKDSDVRWKAADKLARIGTPAVAPLITALRNEDADIRLWVASILGKIKDPRAIEPLIVALKDDNSDVRDKAAWALSQIGLPAVELLIDALNSENLNVRKGATWALTQIKDPPCCRSSNHCPRRSSASGSVFSGKGLER